MNTAGQLTCDTPNTDGQVFVPLSAFSTVGTAPVLASAGPGLLAATLATGTAYTLFACIDQMLRTGVAPQFQEAFGTAALVPGPTAVPNTGDPESIQGYPPYVGALTPTVFTQKGFKLKGIQINWIDLIYTAIAGITSATLGLTTTRYVNNTAPLVANLITLGANGLPVATQALPYRSRVSVAAPLMIALDGAQIILNANFTTGAGNGTFYGAVAGVTFNFN